MSCQVTFSYPEKQDGSFKDALPVLESVKAPNGEESTSFKEILNLARSKKIGLTEGKVSQIKSINLPINDESLALVEWANTYYETTTPLSKEVFQNSQGEFIHPRLLDKKINDTIDGPNAFDKLDPTKDYTVKQLLETVISDSKVGFNRYLAQLLLTNIPEDFNIVITTNSKRNVAGVYRRNFDQSGKLIESIELYSNNKGFTEGVFLHEAVHAATVLALDKRYELLTEEEKKVRKDLTELYNLAKQYMMSKGKKEYAFTNIKEFVAELMSNASFRDELMKLKLNKKYNILTKFAEYILKLLGFKGNTSNSSDNLFVVGMDRIVRLADLNKSLREKNNQDLFEEGVSEDNFELTPDQKKIITDSDALKVGIDPTTGKETKSYTNLLTGEVYSRVGNILDIMKDRVYDTDFATYQADQLWEGKDPLTKLKIDLRGFEDKGELNKEQFTKEFSSILESYQLQGTIRELVIKHAYTNDAADKIKLDQLLEKLRLITGKPDLNMDWITYVGERGGVPVNNLQKIHTSMGSNIYTEGVPEAQRDVLKFGVKSSSKSLNIAGAMDMAVMHADGSISGVELKTGRSFLRVTNQQLLKHGRSLSITGSPKDMAKLQLQWYALLFRLNNPNVKFRNLRVLVANNESQLYTTTVAEEVDSVNYLRVIQEFLRDPSFLKKHGLPENAFELLEQEYIANGGTSINDLFNPSNYFNETNGSKLLRSATSASASTTTSPTTELDELVSISKGILGPLRSDKVRQLQQNATVYLSKLKKIRSTIDASGETNIFATPIKSTLSGKLYQMGDWDSDVIRAFGAIEARQEMLFNKESSNRTNIIAAYKRKIFGDRPSFIPNKERFKKFFTEQKIINENNELVRTEVRLLHGNEKIGSAEKAKWDALSREEQEMLVYFNNRIKSWVSSTGFFSQKNIQDIRLGDEMVSEIDLLNREKNRNFEYYEGWYPKVPISNYTELQENLGVGKGMQIVEAVKSSLTRLIDDITKAEIGTVEETIGIPLKYMGSTYTLNDPEKREAYTYDIFTAMSKFEAAMIDKQYMDPVYHLGRVMSNAFELAEVSNQFGVSSFPNKDIAKWLNDYMQINIRKYVNKGFELRSPLTIVSKDAAKTIDTNDIILKLNGFTASAVMSFRLFSVVGNVVGPGITNLRGRLTNEFLKFLNVDDQYLDTRLSSHFKVNKEVGAFLAAKSTNTVHKNKAFLLAQQNNFMINFDASRAVSNNVKASRFSFSSLFDKFKFYLQNTSEEITSLNLTIAQLYNIKHNDKPLYDYYEVFEIDEDGNIADTAENRRLVEQKKTELGASNVQVVFSNKPSIGAYSAEYVGGVRFKEKSGSGQDVTYTEIRGLSDREVKRIQAVYDRKHGEYRKRYSSEVNALASSFFMLHRYIPRMFKNIIESRKQSDELGRYVEIPGEDGTYEWQPEFIQGRLRLVMAHLFPIFSKAKGTSAVNWGNMSVEEKRLLIDTYLQGAMYFALYGTFVLLFGDSDDDETMKKWFKRYALENPFQEVNPAELIKTAGEATIPVPVEALKRFVDGSSELLMAGVSASVGNEEGTYNTKGEVRGLNKVMRAVPITAWAWDTKQKLENSQFFDESKGTSED
jgi:hypothetical protein